MAGVKIKVTFTNKEAAFLYLNKVYKKLQKPDVQKPVNAIGAYWQRNFKGQGSEVGGWAGLADETIKRRQYQGYGAGPILYRYGSLYRVTAFFANQKGSGSRSESTPYDKRSGHSTSVVLKMANGMATLQAGGPKIYNQWPTYNAQAREFWLLTPGARKAARQGALDWLTEDVILGT